MADLSGLKEGIERLTESRNAAAKRLAEIDDGSGNRLDLTISFNEGQPSFIDADARILAVTEMMADPTAKKDALLIPISYVTAVKDALDKLISRYESIVRDINNIANHDGPGPFNSENGVLTSRDGQVSLKLAAHTQNLWNETEPLLASLYPLLFAVRIKGQPDFTPLLGAFKAATEQAQADRNELSRLVHEVQASHEKVAQFEKQSAKLKEEIERLQSEGAKDRTTLSEYTSEGTTSVASIRSTKEEAEQLKSQVESYKAEFERFQKQLDQREKAIADGTARQKALITGVEEIEKEIGDLNERAEDMLSGATVAGLASSFGEHRDKLNTELENARKGFYVAIGFLFVSVLPLAAYVIPGLGELVAGSDAASAVTASNASELIGQIAARALLLLPSAWLTKFAASRYASVFKLKEHYVYKYSVATSVEGFKKQAEPYKDEIAAATFFELTMNPANRLEKGHDEERHPNPIMEYLMKRIGATSDGR